jgi:hypothetical protein
MLWLTNQRAIALSLSLMLPSVGCDGPKTVTAKGSVVKDGQPIPLSKTGVIQVILQPDVGPDVQYNTYPGRCDAAGKFEIVEVPPGRYKVGIEILDPTPQDDKLRGQMVAANSKIIREIDGKAPIAIDLSKPGP